MKFYGLKNCDTCRKAVKALEAAAISFEYVDVRADGVPATQVENWLSQIDAKTLVNTRSTTWRGLSDAEKSKVEDTSQIPVLLEANPTLIKRPVIEQGADIFVGWTKETQTALKV